MAYGSNLRFLVGKLETTPGTMETLTAADFDVRVRDPEITPIIEPDDEASKFANGNHGEDEVVMGAQSATIAFNVRMADAGDDTTEPAWWKYANGCGAKKITYGGTGIALQPRKEYDTKTMTIWVYDIELGGATPAGKIYKFAGCAGNCQMGPDGNGKPWVANFSFTGKLSEIVDVANASIPEMYGIDTSHPEKALNNFIIIGGVTGAVTTWQLDAGNEVTPLPNQGDVTGYDYFQITARRPRFSADPIMMAESEDSVYADMVSGLTGAISTKEITVTGNQFTLTIPKSQQIQAGIASRDNVVNWDANYKCLANGVTGSLADSDLEPEVTWELLIGSRS